MSKPTAGPWNVVEERTRGGDRIIVADSRMNTPVAYAGDFNRYDLDAEVDANARLIAAAPAMLDLLKLAANRSPVEISEFCRMAETILAQIEGTNE